MIHLGDITKIRGDEIPPVDCITGGSPCQDLSVAGKRAGLEGERSGLFMEQIRIVKEMRERDRRAGRTAWAVRPRFMVWENVPGAFSSNGGKDFQAVLTEIVKIVEPDAPDVPLPDKGKWPKAGCLYSDVGDWSIAWRVHDAQFWGVPQRRKRIALVADFGGLAAPEILFERESLSRDPEPRGAEGQGAAAGAESGAGSEVFGIGKAITTGGNCTAGGDCVHKEYAPSLTTDRPHAVGYGVVYGIDHVITTGGNCTAEGPCVYEDVEATLKAAGPHAVAISFQERAGKPGGGSEVLIAPYNAEPQAVYCLQGNGDGETVPTMTGDHQSRVTDYTALALTYSNQAIGAYVKNDKASSLKQRDFKDATDLVVTAVDCRNDTENPEINGTLQAKPNGGTSLNLNNVCRSGSTVRRLTPTECERLQGFPDGWTGIGDWVDSKGKKHKAADSPRYKALGNSIALPFWFWLLRRISAQYERPATLGSLFDGIGGFPLCWERCNGPGTAVWASEIEEFPIAVTKKHFPEEKEDT